MKNYLLTISMLGVLGLTGCNESDTSAVPTDHSTNNHTENSTSYKTEKKATDAADNTARNARDDGTTKTPIDQSNDKSDLAITKAAREAVVNQDDLSVNGKNIKIITNNGTVTLRGPVASETERETIVKLVRDVPAVVHVNNQLEVANP